MRLLLDVHLSGRAIGRRLREEGHDVVAASEHPRLRVMDDEDLLKIAADDERILVTCDVADVPGILRDWAEERRSHAGCILLVGLDHGEFGTILRRLRGTFDRYPRQNDWGDLALYVGRQP